MSILQSELFTCVLPVDIKPQENISLRVMLSFSKLRDECVLSNLSSGTHSIIRYFDSGNQLNKNYFYSSSKGKKPKKHRNLHSIIFSPSCFPKLMDFNFSVPDVCCFISDFFFSHFFLFNCFYCTSQASRLLQDSKDKPTSLVVRETCQTPSTQQQQQPQQQQQQQQPAASPSQPSKPVEQSKVDSATPAVQQQGRDSVGFSKLKVLLRT